MKNAKKKIKIEDFHGLIVIGNVHQMRKIFLSGRMVNKQAQERKRRREKHDIDCCRQLKFLFHKFPFNSPAFSSFIIMFASPTLIAHKLMMKWALNRQTI